MDFSILYSSQGKVREKNKLFSRHIIFNNSELHVLLCEVRSIMCITYLIGFIFFTSFCKYVNWGSGKKWMCLTTS